MWLSSRPSEPGFAGLGRPHSTNEHDAIEQRNWAFAAEQTATEQKKRKRRLSSSSTLPVFNQIR